MTNPIARKFMIGNNLYWRIMYNLFKKRRPIPKDLLDFDETYRISDVVKEELEKK